MEFDEFDARLREVRAQRESRLPEEFTPFEFLKASEADIQRVKHELGVKLPEKYARFMREYGGGSFLFLDLLPVRSGYAKTEDLVSVNRFNRDPRFVAVAPVGTGDWWGFPVTDGICGDAIGLWFHDEPVIQASDDDFLDFLARCGLSPHEQRA